MNMAIKKNGFDGPIHTAQKFELSPICWIYVINTHYPPTQLNKFPTAWQRIARRPSTITGSSGMKCSQTNGLPTPRLPDYNFWRAYIERGKQDKARLIKGEYLNKSCIQETLMCTDRSTDNKQTKNQEKRGKNHISCVT